MQATAARLKRTASSGLPHNPGRHPAAPTTHLPLGAFSPLTMAGLGLAPAAAAATATRPSRRADHRAALMGWPAGVEGGGQGRSNM